ncbi:MAG: SRPBCC family protein [Ginsengibacter sp.]
MILSKIHIKEPASKIWEALTQKNKMKEWYFDIPDFEFKEGAVFNFYEPGDAKQFHHRCEIKEIVPGKKFSHTWTHPELSKGESIVTWILEEEGGQTNVTLQHEGTENFADAGAEFAPENYQLGWDGFMAVLKNYMYGVRKHIYKVDIQASAEKVWNVLFNDETYRQWTSELSPGLYIKGEIKKGSRIHFLSADGSGMYSDVAFLTPNENVYFQHIGEIINLEEQPIDEATEKWTGAFENYILKASDKITTLTAEVDLTPDHAKFYDQNFPKALEKVKALSENKE